MKKLSRITLGLLSAGLLASNVHAAIIKIDGSSTVYPVTEAVAEEFQITTKEKVTVGVSGTGGGFKKFCRGETDISNASRPILKKEMELCAQNGIKAEVTQMRVIEIANNLSGVDLVVTTMRIKPDFDVPYVNGMAFLTGINKEATEEKILSYLKD